MIYLSDRSDYQTLSKYVYLNQASLGLISNESVAKMVDFLKESAQHGNAMLSDSEEIEILNPVRRKLAKLVRCSFKNIAVLSSASEFLSQIPYMINAPNGGKVILVSSDFPSLIRPWYGVRNSGKNFQIELVQDSPNESLTEKIIRAVDKTTVAVVVSHVQFSTGTKVDYKVLKHRTDQIRALFILDVTQSLGVIPIGMEALPADALVASGYKWLGGHGGAAFAILSEKFLKLDPLAVGWMSDPAPFNMSTKDLQFAESALKFTQSTISYVTIKGLEISLDRILKLSPNNISSHASTLSSYLLDSLSNSGWTPFRSKLDIESSPHIIAISSKLKDTDEYFNKMRHNKIIASIRNGRIRISLSHYNSEDDIDKVLAILLS